MPLFFCIPLCSTTTHCCIGKQQQGCVASAEAALRAADLPVEDEVGLAAGVMVLYNLLFSMAAAAGELDIQAKEAELRY